MVITFIFIAIALLIGFAIGVLVGKNKGDIRAESYRVTNEITTVKNEAHVAEEGRLSRRVDKLEMDKFDKGEVSE